MTSATYKDYPNNLINEIKSDGYFSGMLSTSLYNFIVKSVYNDIINKYLKFKKIKDNTNTFLDLGTNVLNTLSKFNDSELEDCFGHISCRYLSGNSVAIEISHKLREYFLSLYSINFSFNGIRDFDRKKILPNVSEKDTVAIFYRIYSPNKQYGLPHRDFDFWEIDEELPKIPFRNTSRIKFWMPIVGCNELNSLRIWPKSYRSNVKTKYIEGKFRKSPFIDIEDLKKFGSYVVPASKERYFAFFDDKTIHQGPKNINKDKFGFRISLEANLFVDSNLLK